MKFEIVFLKEALEQLKKLDKPIIQQIIKKLRKLSDNPFLAKPLSNEYKNYRSEHIGKYRVVFSIKQNIIIIAKIGHRKKVYG